MSATDHMTTDDKALAEAAWIDLEVAASATGALEVARLTLPIEKVRALVADREALPMTTPTQAPDVASDAAEFITMLGKYADHSREGWPVQVSAETARRIAATLARQSQEIETLRAERDDLALRAAVIDEALTNAVQMRRAAEASLTAAQEQIAALEEANAHANRMQRYSEDMRVAADRLAVSLKAAAERVCAFDWSDNDADAVATVDALRSALTAPQAPAPEAVAVLPTQAEMNQAFYKDVCQAEDRLKEFIYASRRLLDSLPAHWHGEAETDLRDLCDETHAVLEPHMHTPYEVEQATKRYGRSALIAPPPSPDMEKAVEAATIEVQEWLDWCAENKEEPEAYSGARNAISAYLAALGEQPVATCAEFAHVPSGEQNPVGWFNPWNEYHGYQQVAEEFEGSPGTIPLYAIPQLATVSEEMVDAAIAAENAAFSNVRMVECKRCEGRGYHHGFGEDGADPDWCSHCGGGGYEAAEGEDTRPMREALAAAIRALGKEAE